MTDTLAPDTGHTPGEHPGTIEHVDPHALILDANVRDEAALDARFVASIGEHGVLIPIAAVRGEDGRLRVRAGQRRTLAAREAGLPTVPVYVRTAAEADETAQLVARVTEQIVENDQRRQLTDAQRARGIQQMIDAGVSIPRVAKKLSVPKDTVKAAAVVAKSDAAMRGLAEGQFSLDEAAAITEFEDMPGALSRLTQAAGTARFEHTVAQLREEKASAEAEAQAAQGFVERGFTWLSDRPQEWDPDCIPLYRLHTADGAPADERAVTDPAHWAVQFYEADAVVDVQTGAVVDEDDVDWDTRDDPGATPADGLRHAATVTEATVFVPHYFCLDYRAAGLTPDPWFARNAGMVDTEAGDRGEPDAGARAAARVRAEAERAEADKRERRKVLALNKLGAAALCVRREFVSRLLARRTPPKGAAIFVADALARDSYLLTGHNNAETIVALLGLDGPGSVAKVASTLPASGDARAQVLTLALVLGALEARTPKEAWRNAATGHWSQHVTCADYLRWLAANGYTLAPVEEIITGAQTADEVYEQYLTEAAGK
ncbi:nuclease [Mycobacterium simiae]|uniref:Nuclease n=1 Tax=Mycobacterium simiae TaxID=1784 RepID=A0A5B1BPY2_MYCSI|nr:ParB N-terminal domain-containing protein [Mycobacterium simiae]KAA1250757.1 nuclease [Mycobacterium simiae]